MRRIMDNMKTIHIYGRDSSSTIEVEGDGPDVFRKLLNVDDPSNMTELAIAKLLKQKPMSHVVKIYDIVQNNDECYIDMEYLEDRYVPLSRYVDDFKKGLQQLHSIGVVYIDIKSDNIAYSKLDGVFKIFDFDCSGIVDMNQPNKWLVQPFQQSYMYRQIQNKEPYVETLFALDILSWELAYRKRF